VLTCAGQRWPRSCQRVMIIVPSLNARVRLRARYATYCGTAFLLGSGGREWWGAPKVSSLAPIRFPDNPLPYTTLRHHIKKEAPNTDGMTVILPSN